MKWMISSLVLMVALAGSVTAGPAADKPWFDLENCAMCKAMTAQPGLMDHMTWDTHNIATGMMSICTVEPAYADAFHKAGGEMEKVMKDLEAGKTMNLCGMCMSYGALMQAGAKADEAMAGNAHVMTLTSTDPKVIEKIHAHADRTVAEYKKMKDMKADKSMK